MTAASRAAGAALLALLIGAKAHAMTEAEGATLTQIAKAHPHHSGSQAGVDLASRLGAAGDMQALDHLIALRHGSLLGNYVNGFKYAHQETGSPAMEERILAHYQDARIASQLMTSLTSYASPALFDRLLLDVADYARISRDEARRCRVVPAPPPVPEDPRVTGSSRFPRGQPQAGRTECSGGPRAMAPERFRAATATTLIARTNLPYVSPRIHPFFADLMATPAVEESVRRSPGYRPMDNPIERLAPMVRRFALDRYQAATPELLALLDGIEGTDGQSLRSAEIVLRALGEMDNPEGTKAIVAWIERRAQSVHPATESPRLLEWIALLGPVLPAAQADVSALRTRLIAGIPPSLQAEAARTFEGVEKQNASLRAPTEATLVQGAGSNNYRIVRHCLQRGIPANARDELGETALNAARHHFEMQRFLVEEAGANPDMAGRGGATPFQLLVGWFPSGRDPYRALDYFRAKGARLEVTESGKTSLQIAAGTRSPDIVKYLLQHGARVDVADAEGFTPLLIAARQANTEHARLLLDAGARVDARTREGRTPLHFAAAVRKVDLARLLLDRGADVNASVDGGLTPRLVAADAKDTAMEEFLASRGGLINPVYVAARAARRKAGELLFRGAH